MANLINRKNLKTSTAIVAAIIAMQSGDVQAQVTTNLIAAGTWGSTAGLLVEGNNVGLTAAAGQLNIVGSYTGSTFFDNATGVGGPTPDYNYVIGNITGVFATGDAINEVQIYRTTASATTQNVTIGSITLTEPTSAVFITNGTAAGALIAGSNSINTVINGNYSTGGTTLIQTMGDGGADDFVDVTINGNFNSTGATTILDSVNTDHTRLTLSGTTISGAGGFVLNDGGTAGNVYLRIDGAQATGNVTTAATNTVTTTTNGTGVLEIKGGETANTITLNGAVGTLANRLYSVDVIGDADALASNIYFNQAVYAVNSNVSNVAVPVTYNNVLNLSGNLTFGADNATVNLNNSSTISGAVQFGNYNGVLNLANGIAFTAPSITSTTSGKGVVSITGNTTVGSNIGSAVNSIGRLDFLGAGGTLADPVTFSGKVYSNDLRFAGNSVVEFTGTNVGITGNVTGGSYSGSTFTPSQTGTLLFIDNGAAQTADIDGNVNYLNVFKTNYTNAGSNLNIDNTVSVATLSLNGIGNNFTFGGPVTVGTSFSVVDINNMDANTNAITFNNGLTVSAGGASIEGNATFNGTLNVTGNVNISGSSLYNGVTNVTGNIVADGAVTVNKAMTATGNITLNGGGTSAAGALITANNLTLAGATSDYTLNGIVNVTNVITISGDDVTFNDDITTKSIRDNSGSIYNGEVTISDKGGIATTADPYAWDVNEASTAYSYFEDSIFNDILKGGADIHAKGVEFGAAVIANNIFLENSTVDGSHFSSTLNAANLVATGTNTLDGIVTITGDIVSNNSTNLTFGNTVSAANIYAIEGGTTNFTKGVVATDLISVNGATTFSGTVGAATLTTTGGAVAFNGNVTVTDMNTAGNTTFGVAANVIADTINTTDTTIFNASVNAATFNAAGTTSVNSTLIADTLTSTGNTTVTGVATIDTVISKNATNITFGSTLNATTGVTTEAGGVHNFNGAVYAGTLTLDGTNNFDMTVEATTLTANGGAVTVDGVAKIATITAESLANMTFSDRLETNSIITKGGTSIFADDVDATEGTITVNGTNTFGGQVNTTVLGIDGTSTFNVGPVFAATVNASGTSTFNAVLTATNVNVINKGDVIIAANGSSGIINFTSDGIVRLTSGINWTGDIGTTVDNSKIGTLELQGDRSVNAVLTVDTIKAVNVGDDGSVVAINSNVNAVTLQIIGGVLGTGETTVNVDLTTDLVFLDEGEVIISEGRSLTKNIDTAQLNNGTLTFASTAAVSGDIGNLNALNTVNINKGTVTFSGDVNTKNFIFEGNGKAVITSSSTLLAQAIDSTVDNQGTLTIYGNATISSTVGAAHTIELVQAGYGTSVVTFDDTMRVGTLEAGSGYIYLNDDASGTLRFDQDGVVTIASGKNWTGSITSSSSGIGKLVLLGNRTISSAITDGKVKTVGVASNGSVITVNSSVNATNLEIVGTGTATVNTNLNNNLLFSANGTTVVSDGYNLLKNVDSTDSNIGTLTIAGTTTISGTVGATYAVNLINAGEDSKIVTFSNDVKANTIAFNGAGSLVFADGVDLTVAAVTAQLAGTGSASFKGINVVNATIGSAATPLADIYAGYNSGVVTFNNSISATEVHVTGTGTVNINGGGNGEMLFDATTGTAVLADDTVWAGKFNGAANNKGNIVFSGDATGITSIGSTAYLNSMTLNGNNNTVEVNGDIKSAATLNLGNNTLLGGTFTTVTGQRINTNITSASILGNVQTTGLATVHSGTVLNVNVNSPDYIVPGSNFLIVEGGPGSSISSLSNDITTSNVLLDFDQAGSGNELTVSMDYKPISALTSDANLIEAGNVFFSMPYNTNAYMQSMYVTLQNATDMTQIRSVLDSFLPEVDGGDKNVVMDNNSQIQYLAEQRIEDLRLGEISDYGFSQNVGVGVNQYGFETENYGFSSDEEIESYGFSGVSSGDSIVSSSMWGQVYFNHMNQDTISGIRGYSSDSIGGAVGIDNSNIISNGIVGVSLNFGTSTIESEGVSSATSDITNYGLNFYSNYEFDTGLFVNTQFGFSSNDIAKERPNAGGAAYIAKADYGSSQIAAKVAVGVDIFPVNGVTITPSMSLSETMVDTDGYTETGANTGFNMTVGGHEESLLRVGLKVDANMKMMDEFGTIIRPSLKVGYFNDLTNDPVVTISNFEASSTSFTTTGPKSAASSFLIGGGVDYSSANNWEISTDVDYMYKEGFNSYTGIARLTSYF